MEQSVPKLRHITFRRRGITKKKAYNMIDKLYFLESHAIYEITWKNIVVGQATDDNMAHAHCLLDN